MDKKLQRLILKEDDVLLVKIPVAYFRNKQAIVRMYEQIKRTLLPRKNKILMLPEDINISVIGEKEIKEHITNIDLWSLWSENGEEIGETDV